MENKKLLKFLYKDINELEEIFNEKGSSGFDTFEIEFVQSRFSGAKQIIQILNEKENRNQDNTQTLKSESAEPELEVPAPPAEELRHVKEEKEHESPEMTGEPVKEASTEIYADKIVESAEPEEPFVAEPEETVLEETLQAPVVEETLLTPVREEVVSTPVQETVDTKHSGHEIRKDELELADEEEVDAVSKRLGDSFVKEKSVNDMLSNGTNKLEYKISNSPVSSIQTAIGVNDRYQYIRELFDGSGERFLAAVTALDGMANINEAVAYLQQNYKWKKNETSLKFVNLVKRRFSNG